MPLLLIATLVACGGGDGGEEAGSAAPESTTGADAGANDEEADASADEEAEFPCSLLTLKELNQALGVEFGQGTAKPVGTPQPNSDSGPTTADTCFWSEAGDAQGNPQEVTTVFVEVLKPPQDLERAYSTYYGTDDTRLQELDLGDRAHFEPGDTSSSRSVSSSVQVLVPGHLVRLTASSGLVEGEDGLPLGFAPVAPEQQDGLKKLAALAIDRL